MAGLAGALLVYTLAGAWLLPALIQSQVPKYAQSQLQRRASIGAVSFNPFTLRLQADDVHLGEADGAPLFDVGTLVVEADWRSLPKRAWSFAEIRIATPVVSLAIAPDGRFNIADFIATLNREPKQESSGMPRLIVRHFALERGKVDMRDRRAGYADTYTPIDFSLNNLTTLPDEDGDYTFSADVAHGGKLRWKGAVSLNPIDGNGLLTLENIALPGLAAYLKSYSHATLADGKLSARLPYRFNYHDGQFGAHLTGASLSLRDLALQRDGATFAKLASFDISDVNTDLLRRSVTVGALRIADGSVSLRRDAQGKIDLANLMLESPAPAAAVTPPLPPTPGAPAAAPGKPVSWKVQVKQVKLDGLAFDATDETVSPALKLSAGKLHLGFKLDAEQAGAGMRMMLADAAFSLSDVAMSRGTGKPFTLEHIGFDDGLVDLAARHVSVGRVYADGAQIDLSRDAQGQFALLSHLPKFASAAAPASSAAAPHTRAPRAPAPDAAPSPAWTADVKQVEVRKFAAKVDDAGTGIKSSIEDFQLTLSGASSDLAQPVRFETGLRLHEGGQLSARGKLVPARGSVDADVTIDKLALAPVQPLLAKYLKLKIANGAINAKGHLTTGAGGAKDPAVRYAGSFDVSGLTLNETDGDLFAAWKSVAAAKLNLSVAPNQLEIPELRVIEPNAKLIIEDDRSFNASRLLVKQAAATPAAQTASVAAPQAKQVAPAPTPARARATASASTPQMAPVATPQPASAAPSDAAFPVRVRRVRFQNAKLDFTDLSLRPQFSAKIYELNGVVTGLSTRSDARSQIELDGRVDAFGLARVRGELNPFAPTDNTDLSVVFKNIDMVSASPYAMKFAGYKIAEGKISLDLQYKVRKHMLEGQNQVIIDKLTLGDRIDSPDALKLPLELALAILKDSDGRIDLGLPVSGNMDDPQFSYGALVWKAIGNVLTKIVTSPFRALGNLLGVGGDKLESIDFDAGSAVLLPPEQEKLQQVAKVLASRKQLTLSVPGQYSEAADGAALRASALRRAVATRAGMQLAAGEEPGPLSVSERKVRGALRDLYAERFGAAQLDQQKAAAEKTAAAPADAASQGKLPMWRRLGKMIQGEPQVADPTAFYAGLQERLEKTQPVAADALTRLGERRSSVILTALQAAGVAPASARAAPVEKVAGDAGKPVPLKLGLSAK